MGGAIAQLVAREHPDVVSGLVLSGTAQHWQEREIKRRFRGLGLLGLSLAVAPRASWQRRLQAGRPRALAADACGSTPS